MFNDDELITPGRDLTVNECAIFYHWVEEKVYWIFMYFLTIYLQYSIINFFSRYPNF